MASDDVCFLTIAELAPLIAQRHVSPVEVVTALLARMDARNDALVAYVHISREQALAAARAAEMEIMASGVRGPLHGIPVAYKDIYDVAGLPTTAASKVLAGNIATEDSSAAARLRQAGAICMGKLNTLEFASGSMEVFGSARNPWNTSMFPGGSSSGSGVALAGHLVHGATGSDTGGSIRNPASFCGIVGLKPTYGRISRAGVIPLSWSLDHAGPMARTVTDTALLLQALAGPDRRDPSAALHAVPDYTASLHGDLRGVRLGVPRTYFFAEGDPEVLAAVRQAIRRLQGLGATVYDIDLPFSCYASAASWSIAYTEAFAFHRSNFFTRSQDYTGAFLHKITGAALLTAEEQITAQRVRQIVSAEFLAALRTVDVIVTPTTAYPAQPIGSASPQSDMHSLTRPVSLTGLPALAVPCGFSSTGLPLSMQLVGRAWEEQTLLHVGYAYEQDAGWYRQRPPLTARQLPTPSAGAPPANPLSTQWVLDMARLTGLTYVNASNAAPIAASIGPAIAQLHAARQHIAPHIEPPVRAVAMASTF